MVEERFQVYLTLEILQPVTRSVRVSDHRWKVDFTDHAKRQISFNKKRTK